MERIFVQLLNMSYQAGIAVCFVLLARWVFSWCRAPRKYSYYLWAVPFIRFCCPFSLKSIFSLLPKEYAPFRKETVNRLIDASQNAEKLAEASGIHIRPLIDFRFLSPTPEYSADPIQILTFFCCCIWIVGIAVLLVYSAGSLIVLKRKLSVKVRLRDNIYLADGISMPFVLGFIVPKIYLPSDIGQEEMEYVLLHEQTHVRRGDSIIKAAAFFLTVLHWFNPLAWAAFLCLGSDMETSCDEAVMKELGEEACSGYAKALLKLGSRRIGGIPLAFGEGNIKKRVKNVMRYKKSVLFTSVFALLVIAALSVGLLTVPKAAETAGTPEGMAGTKETAETVKNDTAGTEETEKLMEKDTPWTEETVKVPEESSTGTKGTEEIMEKNTAGTNETAEVIEITIPQLSPDTPLGADGAILDYAENGRIIFHGSFGLFVYSMGGIKELREAASERIIAAVDLQAIGCHYTQGDNYCEVMVSEDGDRIYLHPLREEDMYVYDIVRQSLTKQRYSLDGVSLFKPQYVDRSEIPYAEENHICSPYGFSFDGGSYYGYLISSDQTIGTLAYLEYDMIVPFFYKAIQKE